MKSRCRWLKTPTLWLVGLLLFPSSADAQEPLGSVLTFLLTNQSVQTGDFTKDAQATRATSDTVSRALLVDVATLPVSAAAGGFTYRLNPSVGTLDRASENFGPFFTERALTAGRNQFSFGAAYRFVQFDQLGGTDLRSGALVTTANRFLDEPRPFDVETLKLTIRANSVTLFANYGITDRLDVGAALPFVSLTLDGSRTDTYRGETFLQAKASARATGLADLALRAKYHALGRGADGLAIGAEVRVPTGAEENLLGAGSAAFKVLAVGSIDRGRLASSVNAAFSTGGVSDELDYNFAGTWAAATRLTLIGEVLGRRIDNLGPITQVAAPHPTIAGVETIRLVAQAGGLNTASFVAGFKLNLTSTWLLEGHLQLPIRDAGLRAQLSPVVALDYSFVR
jgi:Putative MetA-pathway of phenol degradation